MAPVSLTSGAPPPVHAFNGTQPLCRGPSADRSVALDRRRGCRPASHVAKGGVRHGRAVPVARRYALGRCVPFRSDLRSWPDTSISHDDGPLHARQSRGDGRRDPITGREADERSLGPVVGNIVATIRAVPVIW
jgi:hypothetical protein